MGGCIYLERYHPHLPNMSIWWTCGGQDPYLIQGGQQIVQVLRVMQTYKIRIFSCLRFHRSAGLHETPAASATSSSSGRNSPNPVLGSTPGSEKVFDFPPGMFLGSPIAFPSPHLPPYPSPTLIQPIAQLRQPYIVTITSQGKVWIAFTFKINHCH